MVFYNNISDLYTKLFMKIIYQWCSISFSSLIQKQIFVTKVVKLKRGVCVINIKVKLIITAYMFQYIVLQFLVLRYFVIDIIYNVQSLVIEIIVNNKQFRSDYRSRLCLKQFYEVQLLYLFISIVGIVVVKCIKKLARFFFHILRQYSDNISECRSFKGIFDTHG